MKKRVFLLSVILLLFLTGCGNSQTAQNNYGVFVGLEAVDMDKLKNYTTVVIDAQLFSKKDVDKLHEEGKTVYSYLNIGSVENFRKYYKQFEDITLGAYENWPEERWVDVSNKEWQDYLTGVLAKELNEKDIDGFFLDNADVYYCYPKEEIYNGLLSILEKLQRYHKKIIINGGDTFAVRATEEKKLNSLADGMNQESVFTSINFETQTFQKQETQTTEYYKELLRTYQEEGFDVYLTEYGAKGRAYHNILKYCRENGLSVYCADSIHLEK